MKTEPEEFQGVGTVFLSDIRNVALADNAAPEHLTEILTRHLDHVTTVIEKFFGLLVMYEGDAVLAVWPPHHTQPSHAQCAFDAACELLATLPDLVAAQTHITYDLDIVLGTGEMAGAFLGPIKQYQVVGKAMATADRISRSLRTGGSSVRMSQYTLDLIEPPEDISETGTISRDNLEDLRVFTYCPANHSMHGTP